MSPVAIAPRPPAAPPLRMNGFQSECVAIFTRAAVAFAMPASVGQIYGLLFATPDPLSLDDMTALLGTSRGGTFQSMKWLREVGMIEGMYLPGSRKEHFRAVLNLRNLATSLLRMRVEPHVQNGSDHLERLRSSIGREKSPESEFQRARYDQMARWHRFLSTILPVIRTMAGRF